MQTRRTGLVRHSDLSAEFGEVVEGPGLGAPGVGGGEHPQPTAGASVVAKLGGERPDARPADERHDHVDGVGAFDLGAQLMGQRRLAGGVGEQGRVEHRRERSAEPLGLASGQPLPQGVQHPPVRLVTLTPQSADELGNQPRTGNGLLFFGKVQYHAGDHGRQVSREPVGRLAIGQVGDFGDQFGPVKLAAELAGYQLLPQARCQPAASLRPLTRLGHRQRVCASGEVWDLFPLASGNARVEGPLISLTVFSGPNNPSSRHRASGQYLKTTLYGLPNPGPRACCS